MLFQNSKTTLFEVPDELKGFEKYFYTDEEFELIHAVEGHIYTEAEISAVLKKDASQLIKNAYKRDILCKLEVDGEIKYNIMNMSFRVNNCAVFERNVWENIPENDLDIIVKWHYKQFMNKKRAMTLEQLSENKNTIMPLNEIIEYLKENGDTITVIPCDCKSKLERCNFNRNVCISLGNGINTSADKGLGKNLTLEEGIELLKATDKEGLMHTAEAHSICNCCSCCCYPINASLELGHKGKWPKVNYVVKYDESKCIHCKKCEKRCHFKVFSIGKDSAQIDYAKCWGCGLCVNTCPTGALTLEKL